MLAILLKPKFGEQESVPRSAGEVFGVGRSGEESDIASRGDSADLCREGERKPEIAIRAVNNRAWIVQAAGQLGDDSAGGDPADFAG